MSLEQMNIVIVGHVDHGKSTVIGRLLHDTKSLPEGKLKQIKAKCDKESKEFEYAFLLDALQDEQAQGITIDSARVFFNTKKRHYIIIDAPGHIEFLKNMISGAARAEAALLVIDAEEGIQENSKRHAYMLAMLGIKQITVIINKMDLVSYDQEKYQNIVTEYTDFLHKIDITPKEFIPISAREGENMTHASEKMSWYTGASIVECIDSFKKEEESKNKPARMFVQDVYKFTKQGDQRRIIAGKIDSGIFKVGDTVQFLPSGKRTKIETIQEFNTSEKNIVSAGQSTGFTTTEQIFIKRGEMMCREDQSPPTISSKLETNIFWMGKKDLECNKKYLLKIGTTKVMCTIVEIKQVLNASNLQTEAHNIVKRHEVAKCIIECERPIAYDIAKDLQNTSRFVLIEDYTITGGGIITDAITDNLSDVRNKVILREEKWISGDVSFKERAERFAQKPTFILITGASDVEKISLARKIERVLFDAGRSVYFFGIGNLLRGVDTDITKIDRKEHIRRLAEVGNILLNAGQIVIGTASDLQEKDISLVRTVINSSEIITINQDISADLKLKEENIEIMVTKIIAHLKEKKVIFSYE